MSHVQPLLAYMFIDISSYPPHTHTHIHPKLGSEVDQVIFALNLILHSKLLFPLMHEQHPQNLSTVNNKKNIDTNYPIS